jgi:rhodanese-related sulfurtransferase
MYRSIDPPTLQAMLGSDAPPVLLDVRTGEEFARGHLAQARHIPLAELPQRVNELARDTPLVAYCLSGTRSASACQFLAQRGFPDLYNLEGGIAAWSRAGQPIAA